MDIAKLETDFKKDAVDMNFFDSCIYWDPYHKKSFISYETIDDLVSGISSFGIKQAVLTSSMGYLYDAVKGNEITKKLIKDRKELFGAMVLYPDLLIQGDAEGYISDLQKEGFVLARMFPKKFRHSMKEYCIGGLLDILQNIQMPLMLWHSETDFDTVDMICEKYPELPLILEGSDTKLLYHARDYLMLMKKHEHLYLETHNLVTFNQIADIVKNYGYQRLIFGSYFPYNTPLPSVYNIIKSDIKEDEKHMIAGGNLRELIGYVK